VGPVLSWYLSPDCTGSAITTSFSISAGKTNTELSLHGDHFGTSTSAPQVTVNGTLTTSPIAGTYSVGVWGVWPDGGTANSNELLAPEECVTMNFATGYPNPDGGAFVPVAAASQASVSVQVGHGTSLNDILMVTSSVCSSGAPLQNLPFTSSTTSVAAHVANTSASYVSDDQGIVTFAVQSGVTGLTTVQYTFSSCGGTGTPSCTMVGVLCCNGCNTGSDACY
jgi:hypothetical protein